MMNQTVFFRASTKTVSVVNSYSNFVMKAIATSITTIALMGVSQGTLQAAETSSVYKAPADADNFYKSNQVTIEKVSFKNQFNMRVVGNLVKPKNFNSNSEAPAIIIGHPMGAVKEQSSMLYAQKLAEQGFVTLAIDLPYWGESEGQPRNLVAPEVYSDAFSAAVDFLTTQKFIDSNRIGVLGICGSGSFAISAAKIDPRLKAIATVSMYDMGDVTRNGLNASLPLKDRIALTDKGTQQRQKETTSGKGLFLSYLPEKITAETDPVTKEFWEFYRTPRGIAIPKGYTLEQTQNRMLSSEIRFMNFYPFNDIETISPRPMLFIAGDKAHSKEFSEKAFKLAGSPKDLVWVPGAGHVDLYDRVNMIPWNKLTEFFTKNLGK